MSVSVKSVVLIAAASALIGAAMPSPSLAQHRRYAPRLRHVRPRIEITPRPLLYRRCVERLELQYRPSGPVLYPQTYCWWVRG
ncbi:MAG: hypothetical protein WBF58_11735 [Xanthobacteraceae bacterium]